jgi:hypothetical protein
MKHKRLTVPGVAIAVPTPTPPTVTATATRSTSTTGLASPAPHHKGSHLRGGFLPCGPSA